MIKPAKRQQRAPSRSPRPGSSSKRPRPLGVPPRRQATHRRSDLPQCDFLVSNNVFVSGVVIVNNFVALSGRVFKGLKHANLAAQMTSSICTWTSLL